MKKRIKNGGILAVKTDKSGKLTVMNADKYKELGVNMKGDDIEIDRRELRRIEGQVNAQTKFWTNILNSGLDHGHKERILNSKISESQNSAPKYFMYKDHKIGGGWRPVVGGCSSDTLGLSNTLSEVVESVAMAIKDPYEVISTEDMLSRVQDCNVKIAELRKTKESSARPECSNSGNNARCSESKLNSEIDVDNHGNIRINEDDLSVNLSTNPESYRWDWRDEFILRVQQFWK